MSKIRVGINGFGRIGRCVARAIFEEGYDDSVELVQVNGPAEIDTHLHLLKYDSIHGKFLDVKKLSDSEFQIKDQKIQLTRERNPRDINWDVDVLFECTGIFNTSEKCEQHIASGAKKVLISAPAKDDTKTIVIGVNEDAIDDSDKVLSVGSCTTNCLAPLAKVLDENFGIKTGFMTTIHAYTGDQNIVDSSHKDLYRARAAGLSMVPTSTGAAKALGKVLPQLAGKVNGTAIRVPTANVSLVDFCFESEKQVSVEAINAAIKNAHSSVLGFTDEKLVSIDLNHDSHSSIVDLNGTYITSPNFARVSSWYDNEWGFSCRMIDAAKLIS